VEEIKPDGLRDRRGMLATAGSSDWRSTDGRAPAGRRVFNAVGTEPDMRQGMWRRSRMIRKLSTLFCSAARHRAVTWPQYNRQRCLDCGAWRSTCSAQGYEARGGGRRTERRGSTRLIRPQRFDGNCHWAVADRLIRTRTPRVAGCTGHWNLPEVCTGTDRIQYASAGWATRGRGNSSRLHRLRLLSHLPHKLLPVSWRDCCD
jgi:hypothetical protein